MTTSLESVEADVAAMVSKHGVAILLTALVELADGGALQDVLVHVERRLIRVAADLEAEEVLGGP